MDDINFRKLKKDLSQYIEDAIQGPSVIDLLNYNDSNFLVPLECELLDYKRELPRDAFSIAKTVLQIVSFYNTFGGYLVYGVDQNKVDTEFYVVGIEKDTFDIKKIKDLIRANTGETIDITYCEVQKGVPTIGLLHTPKRRDESPLAFGRNGPDKSPGKPVFLRDQVYFRDQDNCVPALKKEDWQFLFSDRHNPHQSDDWVGASILKQSPILDHNLPDRHFICQKFIGRDDVIRQLWQWLGDDFAHAKLLAGEGGKGKSSIAYEFAEEVCRTRPLGFQKVIWVTAKKFQFLGFHDEFVPVPETHYEDIDSLLRVICSELAMLPEEIDDASTAMLKKLLKDALTQIPALIIIDDIDSLEPDYQRMVLEFAMQMATTRSRFLLTTRMNLSYSADACINISGLQWNEYQEYLETWMYRMSRIKLTELQSKKMHGITEGSPMFTESVLRIINSGMSVESALTQWTGKLGEEVRKAALEREIDNLSVEARRVMLAAVYMQDCSYAELKQVTAYSDERLQTCITELRALFLLSAPSIAEEARFQVPLNTQNLALQNKHLLAKDFSYLSDQVKRLRSGQKVKRTGNQRQIAFTISQANAFLQQKNYPRALATVESAIKVNKNHPDLLLMRGRCQLEEGNGHSDEARKTFRRCFELGQRKDILFRLWYDSEIKAKHPSGGIEAASAALDTDISPCQEWFANRALAYRMLASDRERVGDLEGALSEMNRCRQDIVKATKACTSNRRRHELQEVLFQIHDETWTMLQQRPSALNNWLVAHEEVATMLRAGDQRVEVLQWLLTSLASIVRITASATENGLRRKTSLDLAAQKLIDTRRTIEKALSEAIPDYRLLDLQTRLGNLEIQLDQS